MTASTYEFTSEQNILLGHLAKRMGIVGRVLMTLALFAVAQAFLSGATSVIGIEVGIVLGLLGYWSQRAAVELSRVVRTEGADVSHLMRAVGEIRKVYDVQFWLFIALAVLLGLTLLAAIGRFGTIPAAW